MRTFFNRTLVWLLITALGASCVQENLEDLPPIERQGNVFALFEPGQTLKLQAAITGYSLDKVNTIDSNRVQARLYCNDTLVESFNLQSQTRIRMGAQYRLECTIDQNYAVRGSISLPTDTLLIDTGRVSRLPEPFSVSDSQNLLYDLTYLRTFSVVTPASYGKQNVYVSRGQPGALPFFSNVFFANGQRVVVLESGLDSTVQARVRNAGSPVNLYQINAALYQFLRQARDPLVEPEVVPGNVSVNNMEEGTGIMAYQIKYER